MVKQCKWIKIVIIQYGSQPAFKVKALASVEKTMVRGHSPHLKTERGVSPKYRQHGPWTHRIENKHCEILQEDNLSFVHNPALVDRRAVAPCSTLLP